MRVFPFHHEMRSAATTAELDLLVRADEDVLRDLSVVRVLKGRAVCVGRSGRRSFRAAKHRHRCDRSPHSCQPRRRHIVGLPRACSVRHQRLGLSWSRPRGAMLATLVRCALTATAKTTMIPAAFDLYLVPVGAGCRTALGGGGAGCWARWMGRRRQWAPQLDLALQPSWPLLPHVAANQTLVSTFLSWPRSPAASTRRNQTNSKRLPTHT